MRRQADDPAYQLADEVNRYLDSLYVAAEHRLGPDQVARLDTAADLSLIHISEPTRPY